MHGLPANEGRIRPSLIAARLPDPLGTLAGRQRGANSPLPHCGCLPVIVRAEDDDGNEGRIRPSLIAAPRSTAILTSSVSQRGANSPLPHCGNLTTLNIGCPASATRGEFAPPSLRRERVGSADWRVRGNEGRIRPSLIAAKTWRRKPGGSCPQRGANSPLPHCGRVALKIAPIDSVQRGANSPLPHCGHRRMRRDVLSIGQRGANSPLPHCGTDGRRRCYYD